MKKICKIILTLVLSSILILCAGCSSAPRVKTIKLADNLKVEAVRIVTDTGCRYYLRALPLDYSQINVPDNVAKEIEQKVAFDIENNKRDQSKYWFETMPASYVVVIDVILTNWTNTEYKIDQTPITIDMNAVDNFGLLVYDAEFEETQNTIMLNTKVN